MFIEIIKTTRLTFLLFLYIVLFAAPAVVVSTSCKYSCYEHKRKFMKYFVPQMMFPKQIYSYEYINQ